MISQVLESKFKARESQHYSEDTKTFPPLHVDR
jgi:hypothetical protein